MSVKTKASLAKLLDTVNAEQESMRAFIEHQLESSRAVVRTLETNLTEEISRIDSDANARKNTVRQVYSELVATEQFRQREWQTRLNELVGSEKTEPKVEEAQKKIARVA